MKNYLLSFAFAVSALLNTTAQAQCVAAATLTPTGVPGEFTITDLSNGATQPYSYFQTYYSATVGTVTIPLQQGTTTATIQYPYDGVFSWGVSYGDLDSINGIACFDAYWDSIQVTGVGTPPMGNCQASFYLMQDSLNQNQYWCWNNSIASNPNMGLSYLWDFGDGTTSTQAYPTHTYSGIGTYTLCLSVSDSVCTSLACDTIVITVKASGTTLNVLPAGTVLSLEENLLLKSLKVYPNPSNGNFVVEMNASVKSDVELTWVNLAGEMVHTELLQLSSGINQVHVNEESLPGGIYLLHVTDLHSGSKQVIRLLKR